MIDARSERGHYHALLAAGAGSGELSRARAKGLTWEQAWKARRANPHLNPEAELAALEARGIQLLLREDPAYPLFLKESVAPPFGFYFMGTFPAAWERSIAIVGTRKASASGAATARAFGRVLGSRGFVVVSGLALGIDGAAHAGCLEGGGVTVAVLGNGLPEIYPATHGGLGRRILEAGGAILSEYPPGTPSLPHQFLERNRIVAGLTAGTLVIEAPEASGSRVTARFALEGGRHVFVVPGPATHPNFRGSHELIREGAELVSGPEHILDAFGLASGATPGARTGETREETTVLAALRAAGKPVHVDKIIELTNLNAQIVTQTLGFLQFKNAVREDRDGFTIA